MAFILNIDTSSSICSVGLSDRGQLVIENNDLSGNKHASVLNSLIQKTLTDAGISAHALSAIAVSGGPGSYTGLRIGTSLAKGLCYGLGIPLIAIPTLMGIAHAMSIISPDDKGIYIPMIDARRDDVYMAIYGADMKILQTDTFTTVDSNLFALFLRLYDPQYIYIGGTGSNKIINFSPENKFGIVIENVKCVSSNLSSLSYDYFTRKEFSDLTYYEPYYLKEFEGRMKIK